MSSYEQYPGSLPEVAAASLRFSFMNRDLARIDYSAQEGLERVRYLEYAEPSGIQNQIRTDLEGEGLVLGQRIVSGITCKYRIPRGASPLALAELPEHGSRLAYGDDQMFRDLGIMLRKASSVGMDQYHFAAEIGAHVAIVDLTRENRRKLFFVPGFESYLQNTREGHESLFNKYLIRLRDEFGQRAEDNLFEFEAGYRE